MTHRRSTGLILRHNAHLPFLGKETYNQISDCFILDTEIKVGRQHINQLYPLCIVEEAFPSQPNPRPMYGCKPLSRLGALRGHPLGHACLPPLQNLGQPNVRRRLPSTYDIRHVRPSD